MRGSSREDKGEDPLGDLLTRYVFVGVRRSGGGQPGGSGSSVSRAYENMRDVLVQFFGENMASVVFYKLGEHDGEYFGRSAGLRLGDLDRLVESLSHNPLAVFGLVEARLGRGYMEVVVDNLLDKSVERPYVRGEGGGVGCYYTKGFLKRIVEMVLGKEVEVRETRCGVGRGGFCEFRAFWGVRI